MKKGASLTEHTEITESNRLFYPPQADKINIFLFLFRMSRRSNMKRDALCEL